MDFTEGILGADTSLAAVAARLGMVFCLGYGLIRYVNAKRSPLNAIPTVGYSGILTSYITAFQWSTKGRDLIQEGYDKYPGRAFKVATISKWVVVLNGPQHVDDVRKAPEDVLSFDIAIQEIFEQTTQAEYTFGAGLDTHPHHIAAIRSQITRGMVGGYDDLKDEVMEVCNEYISQSDGWYNFPTKSLTKSEIVPDTKPKSRWPPAINADYLNVLERLTLDVTNTAKIINIFPNVLKPLVGRSLRTVTRKLDEGHRLLSPLVEERLNQSKIDPDSLPSDLVSWLINTATHDYHLTVYDLVTRILVVNFTAIHTTTMAFTQAMYDLAVHPEYVKELREELKP
ncbi:hypothetical protein NP233_g11872 [Leucocoprinus birnbaumii]|uniref:Cytochrome P450 n=1 Tax=Leucocoprinus birnbaumii TaxID=56174 RepID=A0AAD5VJA8_9AGAR|nr:hypothetical protein NP233_g11872 [Leucocoprinus birnbaumii]